MPPSSADCLISGSMYRWAQRQRHTCQQVRLACEVASQKNVRYSINLHKSQINGSIGMVTENMKYSYMYIYACIYIYSRDIV